MMRVMVDPLEAAERARRFGLSLPAPSPIDGRLYTLNERGATGSSISALGEQFLSNVCQPFDDGKSPNVLEIGPAYGSLCIEALRRGITHYTAVELDERHLMILARRATEQLPLDRLAGLRLIHGAFPAGEGVLASLREGEPYDAIIADHVLQFLTEPEVRQAFDAIHSLLKPGGLFFARMMTPYMGHFQDDVKAAFEGQVKAWLAAGKPADLPLPCFMPCVRDALAKEKCEAAKFSPDGFAITREHYFLFHTAVTEHLVADRGKWDAPLSCEYGKRQHCIWADELRSEKEYVHLVVRKNGD